MKKAVFQKLQNETDCDSTRFVVAQTTFAELMKNEIIKGKN